MTYQQFCKQWDDKNQQFFELKTSGSTGAPKAIRLSKDHLAYSAQKTQKTLDLETGKILCCIPTDKIGGFMMMVRAKVLGLDFEQIEPSANPMSGLTEQHDFTFASLVPLQLKTILEDKTSTRKLNRFSHILIGGSNINKDLEEKADKLNPALYHTYGMTETCSHIALRKINKPAKQERFYPLPDVSVALNQAGCLQIRTPFCSTLDTTDLAKTYPDGSFEILGRTDFVINSGGIKISPEQVEKLIAETGLLFCDFAVSSLPDEKLGEKLVLVVSGNSPTPPDFLDTLKTALPPYLAPKQIVYLKEIPKTENGKIRRQELKNRIWEMYNS